MPTLGAHPTGEEDCEFLVWAPFARKVELQIETSEHRLEPMDAGADGYFGCRVRGMPPGSTYLYRLDDSKILPDPASRSQPHGVHHPSEVVSAKFDWEDSNWKGVPLVDLVLYEIHTGTFTPEGTFEAIVPRLPALKKLGVNMIELMPVAQFPGSRNWGYDGVHPFAVQNSYGGPRALRALVNACHREGLGVVLDVVYNHLGPEGNYLRDFGPYFTDRYKTPWGEAINFDGPESDEVRRFFIENALYWVTDCHIDALRLDAIHAIVDSSARPFLQELSVAVRARSSAYVIAESDLNDVRVIQPQETGGFACHSLWSDSFHHSLHTLLTGEHDGYYQDYGSVEHLAKAYSEGFVYTGQYSAFRRRRHGNSTRGMPGERFVVCIQNHDQIGNRAEGDRLSMLVDFESL